MKKILLLLNLIAFTAISQVTPVGGYLPLNSTKSATMGGLRVNGNETVTGTFSVGSTATVSGAFKGNSTIDGASYKMNGTAVVEVSNSRMVLSGGSYTAVEISGTKPLIMNSAVLTGGNTGTVAVLSDALFPVTMKTSALGQSPADGQTYYFANIQFPNFSTEQGNGKIYFPYNVTLVGWTANFYVGTTLGSAENSTLQINIDNSATNLSTAITMSALAQTYTNTGLSINVNANSYVEAKLITPTWATNPTNVFAGIIFWFVRRS